jgi:hypothetical protein
MCGAARARAQPTEGHAGVTFLWSLTAQAKPNSVGAAKPVRRRFIP